MQSITLVITMIAFISISSHNAPFNDPFIIDVTILLCESFPHMHAIPDL